MDLAWQLYLSFCTCCKRETDFLAAAVAVASIYVAARTMQEQKAIK